MPRRPSTAPLLTLSLERTAGRPPLHRQLYEQIRAAVLSGRLAAGSRLPSTRVLAGELGCSRNTVVGAFEQLLAEGYLEGQVGAGTYVSRVLPDELLTVPRRPQQAARPLDKTPALGARGRRLAALQRPARTRPPGGKAFVPGLPETGEFPFDVWGRLVGRFWRNPPERLLRHGEPAGYRPLCEAIAAYLRAVRALRVEPEQVFITSGAQQATELIARALLDPGDRVWIENPGYAGLRGPLLAAGARVVPLPVDGEGLSVEAGRAAAPDARMAVVAPSHQYPLGITMSLARRLALLDWARAADAWIVEDDYDSEYRYAGRPIAPLQSLEREGGRVLYVGSFSKVLFPSLRLGYLVVPPGLAETMTRLRAGLDDHPGIGLQPALAAFIAEGHFAAHVRRMRAIYAERQAALLAAGRRHLGDLLHLEEDEAGLHLVARLAPALATRGDDRAASRRAGAAGIVAPALSDYLFLPEAGPHADSPDSKTAGPQGLLLGYAALTVREIESATVTLARGLRPD